MPIPNQIERKVSNFLVSKTDTKGKILYCNDEFVAISGYAERELLGKPHSIVRHPDMPRTIFKYLWDTLAQGKEVNAYVKNMAKDGSYYWVFANVCPSSSANGQIVAYNSVRRCPSENGLNFVKELYPKLKQIEDKDINEGIAYIQEYFGAYKTTFAEAMLGLQVAGMCFSEVCAVK